jgi:glutamate racemase
MIGMFDSGFGGLHVLKSVTTRLPQYGYIYLGDSARAPYGPRVPEEVYEFTKQGVEFLFSHGAQLVVLACNTASSEALRKIQMEYLAKKIDRKVLGVLIPFAERAAATTKNKRVGVLATAGTVRSDAFVREITKLGDIAVFQQPAPELVPLIEAGKQDSDEIVHYIQQYVAPLLAEGVDTIVLGCTHYGIVQEQIKKAAGENVRIVSEKDVMPTSIINYLERHPEIEKKIARTVPPQFFTTGDVVHFQALGSIFFGTPINAQSARLGI